MPGTIFKTNNAVAEGTGKSQLKKFEEAKSILRWHNPKEKTWIMWEEKPGLFGVVHSSTSRQGSVNGYTFQYCYCCLSNVDKSRLELEVSNPTDTTQNPDAAFLVISTKIIISGPLVKSFIKQFIEKQHGRNKGIIQASV